MKIYSVRDSAAAAFLRPFVAPTDAMAIRGFNAACMDPSHDFHLYPDDYTLFLIGHWDEDQGIVTPLDSGPVLVASALHIIDSKDKS